MMVSLILWANWCDRGHYLTWRHGCFGEVIYAQRCSPPLTEIRASSSWHGTARFPSQENAHGLWPSQVRECLLAPRCWPASWSSAPFLARRQRRRAQTYSSLRCVWFWSWLYIHSRVLGFLSVSQDPALTHHHLPTLLPLSLATKAWSAEGPTSTISWCIPSNCFLRKISICLAQKELSVGRRPDY